MSKRVVVAGVAAVAVLAAVVTFAAGPGHKLSKVPVGTVASPAVPAITDNQGLAKAEDNLNKTNPGSLQGDLDKNDQDAKDF